MIALPELAFAGPAEPFHTGSPPPPACTKPKPQVGVMFFRDFIRQHVGGGDLGIVSCERPKPSDHFDGRAWDWRVYAHVPEEKAMAEAVLAWLMANDWEVFRRLGLKYAIWNRQRYAGGQILPYVGASPHVDHVHFSFGWPGATGNTSFFPAADFTTPDPVPGGYTPPKPGPGPVPVPIPEPEPPEPGLVVSSGGVRPGHAAAAFVAAAIIGYGIMRLLSP